MKVILMQKVERLGEPGQQVDVADGYARNFLLPKQLAVVATPGRVRSLGQLTAQARNREDRAKQEATSLAQKLNGLQVTLLRRAAEETPLLVAAAVPPVAVAAAPVAPAEPGEGAEAEAAAPTPAAPAVPAAPRLFGSVTAQDVSEALAVQGLAVDKKKILLPEPIKTLGVHTVPLRLHADVTAEVTVTVEREA
ncbi:MAG TPA: 50S ribosomal protein L9 [Candidatus Baltobacteraceae bacterium]|nr:50S ribosomal protein L9 [Candidatus Baltobacteraceae bacterium]